MGGSNGNNGGLRTGDFLTGITRDLAKIISICAQMCFGILVVQSTICKTRVLRSTRNRGVAAQLLDLATQQLTEKELSVEARMIGNQSEL